MQQYVQIYFLFCIFFYSFTADSVVPNIQKLRKYDREFYFNHPYQPFSRLIIYNSNRIQLLYVADRHIECKLTQERVEIALKAKPDLIIIEGLYERWGLNPRNWDSRVQYNLSGNCDPYYTYKRAVELKIPFMGTEPGKMRNYSSYERDQNFLKVLYRVSKKYRKILIVYGAGHYVQQELVLNSIWGEPVSIY